MFGAELVIVLLAIYLGARLGVSASVLPVVWGPRPDPYLSN
jgi:anaerobic C4-dicarboxylate transporter